MTENAPVGFDKVVIDSSLLYGTASRRFLMSLWEMHGQPVRVLPKGQTEMHGYLRESERQYWNTRLLKEGERTGKRFDEKTHSRIAKATAEAAGEWVDDELGWDGRPGRNDSMLIGVHMTSEQEIQASQIVERLPVKCFLGTSPDNHLGDRTLIGQCVAAGFQILAAQNRGMLVRNRVNDWLQENGLTREPLVLNGDDAIERAGSWRTQPERMLEATLRATLPDNERPPTRETQIVETFIDRMRLQGLPQIAASCLDTWKSASMEAVYDRARQFIRDGENLARNTEQRRIEKRDAAAAQAGYVR